MGESASASVPARIGLLGNPSDGYFGACISVPLVEMTATVSLLPCPSGDLVWPDEPGLRRILLPTLAEYQTWSGRASTSFRCVVQTDIPRQVGLAGSSAIETALFEALLSWNGHASDAIDADSLAAAVMRVEAEHLGMVAGLQDRLPQAHRTMLHMDFERRRMETTGHALSTPLDVSLLPPLWLAHGPPGQDSGEVHGGLPARWAAAESEMLMIIDSLRECADLGLVAILEADDAGLGRLIDRNFDLRRRLFGDDALGETLDMVLLARDLGSCAKQTGSGGAIFGPVPAEQPDFIDTVRHRFAESGWTIREAVV